MTTTNNDKIKTRIAALLAKAKGTNNEHEAELFLSKVHELLEKHQLDLGDVLTADDPIKTHSGYKMAAGSHAWKRKLYSALGHLYGCKSVLWSSYGQRENGTFGPILETKLVGRESALITVDAMYPWVVAQVREAAKEICKVTGRPAQGQAARVGAALISRIWAMVREEEARLSGHPTDAASKNALATVDLVQQAFDTAFPDFRVIKARATVSDSMSRAAAGKIGLHRQTGNAKTLQLG